jgi:hypothetical protein
MWLMLMLPYMTSFSLLSLLPVSAVRVHVAYSYQPMHRVMQSLLA